MCGRFGQQISEEELEDVFNVYGIPAIERHDIRPSTQVAVVRRVDGENTLYDHRWGLIDPKLPEYKPVFNVKREGLSYYGLCQNAYYAGQLIVYPVTYFEEWAGVDKVRTRIGLKTRAVMGFAGIHLTCINKAGDQVECSSMFTVKPNKFMMPIHDRMPAILFDNDIAPYLDPDIDPKDKVDLLQPYPDDLMDSWVVAEDQKTPAKPRKKREPKSDHDTPEQPQALQNLSLFD